MDPAIVVAIKGVVGAVITYRLDQRQMSDKEQFLRWRATFDRRAFKAPYMHRSYPEPFEKAITDTLLAVRTGM